MKLKLQVNCNYSEAKTCPTVVVDKPSIWFLTILHCDHQFINLLVAMVWLKIFTKEKADSGLWITATLTVDQLIPNS